jgi:hypothetical protein
MARATLHEDGYFGESTTIGDCMAILAREMSIGYVFLFDNFCGRVT